MDTGSTERKTATGPEATTAGNAAASGDPGGTRPARDGTRAGKRPASRRRRIVVRSAYAAVTVSLALAWLFIPDPTPGDRSGIATAAAIGTLLYANDAGWFRRLLPRRKRPDPGTAGQPRGPGGYRAGAGDVIRRSRTDQDAVTGVVDARLDARLDRTVLVHGLLVGAFVVSAIASVAAIDTSDNNIQGGVEYYVGVIGVAAFPVGFVVDLLGWLPHFVRLRVLKVRELAASGVARLDAETGGWLDRQLRLITLDRAWSWAGLVVAVALLAGIGRVPGYAVSAAFVVLLVSLVVEGLVVKRHISWGTWIRTRKEIPTLTDDDVRKRIAWTAAERRLNWRGNAIGALVTALLIAGMSWYLGTEHPEHTAQPPAGRDRTSVSLTWWATCRNSTTLD